MTLTCITYNEEEHLPFWYENHKDLVSTIQIVDTGSFDNTVKVAQKLGIKVIEHEWQHSFAGAKNIGIKNCKTKWIMEMSPDWWISKEDQEIIRQEILDEKFKAFATPSRSHFEDWLKESPTDACSNWPLTLIFLNHQKLECSGRVHEHYNYCLKKLGYRIKFLSNVTRHHDSTSSIFNPHKKDYYDYLLKYNSGELKEKELGDELRYRAYKWEYDKIHEQDAK